MNRSCAEERHCSAWRGIIVRGIDSHGPGGQGLVCLNLLNHNTNYELELDRRVISIQSIIIFLYYYYSSVEMFLVYI